VLILQHHGIANSSALRGGLGAWVRLDYPMAKGSTPRPER